MSHSLSGVLRRTETVIPWLLPALLLFSRALADTTVVLIGLLFLYYSYQTQSWDWCKRAWFRLALLFWGYLILVNLPFSVSFDESLKYALTFIRWPLFAAALAYWLFACQHRQTQFLLSLVLVTVFIIADTAWQYFYHVDWFGIERFNEVRLTGPFRNPVPGTLMLRVWFIALFAIQLWQLEGLPSRFKMLIYPLGLLMGLAFMFITGERMALMLFFAGSVVISSALFVHYREHRMTLLMTLLALGGVFYLIILSSPDMMARSVTSISVKLTAFWQSDYGQVFSAAWQAWQQNLWLGSGIHTYQLTCEQLGLFAESSMQCTHPHNLFLQLGAETGVIGVSLFVVLLIGIYVTALRGLFQRQQWLTAALSFVILTVSFWPLTGGISVLNNWVGALVWLGIGWVLAVSVISQPEPFRPKVAGDH